jgi:3-hydroxy-9,10-secoandrosta-1,3,5(10)-triene-9,17-dione monooxygenase
LATGMLDRLAGGSMTMQTRVKARAHIAYSTGLAREATDILFSASGASSIQEHMPIQRYQRDIQALSNHAIMHPQTGLELYGRILCGLPPNTLLY